MDDTSEILIKEEVVWKLMELKDTMFIITDKKKLLSSLCELYARGYYDDKIIPQNYRMERNYVRKSSANKAREHMRKHGYTKLSDVIEDIVQYEMEKASRQLDYPILEMWEEQEKEEQQKGE